MSEVHRFPLIEVTRIPLDEGVPYIDHGYDENGVLQLSVAESLSDDKVNEAVKTVRERHRARRLLRVPVAALALMRHATHVAGKHTGPTLVGMSAAGLATGAMLTLVVTDAAPPPQAARPAVMAPQSQPDVDADPLPTPVRAPLSLTPGDSPTTPGGRSGITVQPSATGPVASALATAGVPGAGSHPLKPARTMIGTDVKNALPSAVPFPSHPVRCVVQHALRSGKVVNATVCVP